MANIVGFKYSIVADKLKLELKERPEGLFFMDQYLGLALTSENYMII